MMAAAAALALLSAVLHLMWNAMVRGADGALAFVALQVGVGGLAGFAVAWATGPFVVPPSVVPLVVATVLVHGVYFRALAHAYRRGALATVYPAARGLGLMMTTPLAVWLLGQSLPAWAWVGVALITAGIAAPAWDHTFSPTVRWAVLVVGVAIGLYSLVDSHAVSLVRPPVYIALQFTGASVLLMPGSGLAAWLADPTVPHRWRNAAVAGVGSMLSYLLLLYAFQLAPVGPVLALRQIAPALAPVVGGRWLREQHHAFNPRVWAAAALVTVGGALLVWH